MGRADSRRRWCSCFCVIDGVDGDETSDGKSDLTDQEGLLIMASRSSGAEAVEDSARGLHGVTVGIGTPRTMKAALVHCF